MKLWRETVGSRYGGYRPRRNPTKKKPAATNTKTYASVRRGVLKAAEVERQQDKDGCFSRLDPMPALGAPRSFFARQAADARRAASPFWNANPSNNRLAPIESPRQLRAILLASRQNKESLAITRESAASISFFGNA